MKTLQTYLSAFFDLFAPRIDPNEPEVEPPPRSWQSMIIPIILTLVVLSYLVIQ